MAVYTDIIFPACLSYGSEARYTYDTLKVEVSSGAEQRFTRQLYPKSLYRINIENMPANELQEIVNIYHVVRGDLHSFMFKDFADNTSSNTAASISGTTIAGDDQPLGETGFYIDGTTKYNLYKTYSYASRTVARRIRYPVVASLIVNVNGSAHPGADWQWDATTQQVEFLNTQPTNGQAISAGFEYYVPVRFDVGEMGVEPTAGLAEAQIANLNDIRLLEVFE
jgi:uncharacterized protein (TIGR02217 family)